MPLIRIEQVSKIFYGPKGDLLSLDNVSFDIDNTEFLAIIGPSGCGKSTILRMMAGLESPTKGQIYFQDRPIRGPVPGITMVFQNFALLPWKTARENVLIALDTKAMSRHEKEEAAKSLLEKLGLESFENSYPSELSGGMQQRVGIARALAVAPVILLLDEPFSALDEVTARELRKEVLRIWFERSEHPDAIVLVTHLVEEAVLMAGRVLVMAPRPGRVIAEVKIDIPRPRFDYVRSSTFFEYVDRIEDILEKAESKA